MMLPAISKALHLETLRPGLHAGDELRVIAAEYDRQPASERARIYQLVLDRGLEAWREGDEYVFKRPAFPVRDAKAHEQRHYWMLG